MNYVIVSENIEFGKELQNYFKCDLYSFLDEFEYINYDFFILMYDVNKGRCSYDVSSFLSRLNDKYIALIGRGNTGFDINSVLMKRIRNNNNLVVYSKYYKNYKYEEIQYDIRNKVVRTDGRELSEKFVGFLCRIFLRKGR
ncbi:MAG: hypothetical protein ACK5K7_06425 [Bacilli bacterium]